MKLKLQLDIPKNSHYTVCSFDKLHQEYLETKTPDEEMFRIKDAWFREGTKIPLFIVDLVDVVKVNRRDGVDTNEWAIIELQGDLESRSSQSLNDQFIGDLHFTKSGTPILIVGHHILYGKEVTLDKPFVVLKKTLYDPNDREVEKTTPVLGARTDYIAKAIVKRKLVFRVRPKPIIANLSKMI